MKLDTLNSYFNPKDLASKLQFILMDDLIVINFKSNEVIPSFVTFRKGKNGKLKEKINSPDRKEIKNLFATRKTPKSNDKVLQLNPIFTFKELDIKSKDEFIDICSKFNSGQIKNILEVICKTNKYLEGSPKSNGHKINIEYLEDVLGRFALWFDNKQMKVPRSLASYIKRKSPHSKDINSKGSNKTTEQIFIEICEKEKVSDPTLMFLAKYSEYEKSYWGKRLNSPFFLMSLLNSINRKKNYQKDSAKKDFWENVDQFVQTKIDNLKPKIIAKKPYSDAYTEGNPYDTTEELYSNYDEYVDNL